MRHALWTAHRDWASCSARLLATPFQELDVAARQEQVDELMQLTGRLERSLPPNQLVPCLCASLNEWAVRTHGNSTTHCTHMPSGSRLRN